MRRPDEDGDTALQYTAYPIGKHQRANSQIKRPIFNCQQALKQGNTAAKKCQRYIPRGQRRLAQMPLDVFASAVAVQLFVSLFQMLFQIK